jgi:hypothetical protein
MNQKRLYQNQRASKFSPVPVPVLPRVRRSGKFDQKVAVSSVERSRLLTIRGFISGTITKKMGIAVESSKNESGERTYRTGE